MSGSSSTTLGIASILKASCEACDQANGALRGSKQRRPGIGGDRSAIEAGHQ
jgi:hypothetical protein